MTQIIGIDIGGTKTAVIQSDPQGKILHVERFATTSAAQTLEAIYGAVASLELGDEPCFGVACGSPQDSARGIIQAPPHLPDWVDVPITEELTGRFGGRAWLMNDANSSALAEWHWGAGRGARSMVFMTFGTGLGGGLILDGRLYEGACGNAGELGHIRLAESGPVGCFKAGSFEGFCSGAGIAQLAQMRSKELGGTETFGAENIAGITTRHVALAAEAGDPVAREVLAESGRRLGQGLAVVIDLLNPERIVIGSVFARCHAFLEPAMQAVLEKECLPASLRSCTIVPAGLDEALGNYSALAVAFYHMGMMQHA